MKDRPQFAHVKKTATFCNKCAGCAEAKKVLFGVESTPSNVPICDIQETLYKIRKYEKLLEEIKSEDI